MKKAKEEHGRNSYWRLSYDHWDSKPLIFLQHTPKDWRPVGSQGLPIWPFRFLDATRRDRRWFKHFNYPYMAIEMILSGSMEYRNENCVDIVNPGDVFLILRGSNVKMVNADETSRRKLSILIDGPLLDILSDTLGFCNDTLIHLALPEKIESQMRQIGNMLQAKVPGTEEEVSQLTYGLLLALAKEYNTTRCALPEKLLNAVNFMKKNIANDLFIADVAAAAGVSEATLRRFFHRQFGVSPTRYFLQLRLKQSCQLLAHLPLPIKEIAFRTGFSSPLYFTLAFKAFTGITPSEYRRKSKV